MQDSEIELGVTRTVWHTYGRSDAARNARVV